MNRIQRGRLALQDGARGLRVADLDEDEATLAVEAARPLLLATRVQRLEIVGQEVPPWAAHVHLALGLAAVPLSSVASMDAPSPGQPTLRIQADAGRGAAPRDAVAHARVVGATSKVDSPPSMDDGRPIDAAFVARLQEAERQSLQQVPMGAYVPRATWDASLEARYRLLVSTCGSCKSSAHPPFGVCLRCGGATRIESILEGTVYSHTSISKGGGPSEFDSWQSLHGDYGVVVVDLGSRVRVAAMLEDARDVAIGQPVVAVFRRLYAQEGAWRYGVKFRPRPAARS
jgi:uncharacterized OB-fold protein